MTREKRRLAAIVNADVAGYSLLMQRDEAGTVKGIRLLEEGLLLPEMRDQEGRLVKKMGDGFLFEFPSVVKATRWAIKIQATIKENNWRLLKSESLFLRIGIHLADVIVDQDDIFGDGVNVASRLQAASNQGGICISQNAYDGIADVALKSQFVDGGLKNFKNIERPIRVWLWSPESQLSPKNPKAMASEAGHSNAVLYPAAPTLLKNFKDDLLKSQGETPFLVFLCGPSLKATSPSAQLRSKLKAALEAEKIEVVLGEDDGLEDARVSIHANAQDNELEFIAKSCNAVIVVADSVGSFCELGLFSWHFVHENGILNKNDLRTDCVVLIDQQYEGAKSYLNEGPAQAVSGFGVVSFVDFSTYDVAPIIKRMKARRGVMTIDKRGRPRESRA